MTAPLACPSCKATMHKLSLPGLSAGSVQLDVCFACRVIWFDPMENLKLAPGAVVSLFTQMHQQRGAAVQPLAQQMACPRCTRALVQGFDVVKAGRYITHRCPQRHGRLASFAAFMTEKGFVRQLTPLEVQDMAQRLRVIQCSGCGAPVDLRRDQACPYCHAAFSLLDPQAVERALQGYARASQAAAPTAGLKAPDLADALIMVERDRQQALADERKHSGSLWSRPVDTGPDLWALGLELVWRAIR